MPPRCPNTPNRSIFRYVSSLVLLWLLSTPASAINPDGEWLSQSPADIASFDMQSIHLFTTRQNSLPLTGGSFWHLMPVSKRDDQAIVVDFQSSSVIGHFTHYVVNAEGNIVAQYDGGIQSKTLNPYFLRHGRDLNIANADYFLFTHLESPF